MIDDPRSAARQALLDKLYVQQERRKEEGRRPAAVQRPGLVTRVKGAVYGWLARVIAGKQDDRDDNHGVGLGG